MVQACKNGSSDALRAFHHPRAPQPELGRRYATYLFIALDMFNKCQVATAHADAGAMRDMNSDLARLKSTQGSVNDLATQLGFNMKVGLN